jgi:hypothetical protein
MIAILRRLYLLHIRYANVRAVVEQWKLLVGEYNIVYDHYRFYVMRRSSIENKQADWDLGLRQP